MSTPEPARARDEQDRRPEIRIGDREREQAVTHLGVAFGEGRLDVAEYDERVAAAYGAKTASDLLHLTADLPLATREHPATPAPGNADRLPSGSRGPSARTEHSQAQPNRPWLARMWIAYAAAVSINLVIWLLVGLSSGGDFPYFWPMWVAGPWGVILLVRTFGAKLTDAGR